MEQLVTECPGDPKDNFDEWFSLYKKSVATAAKDYMSDLICKFFPDHYTPCTSEFFPGPSEQPYQIGCGFGHFGHQQEWNIARGGYFCVACREGHEGISRLPDWSLTRNNNAFDLKRRAQIRGQPPCIQCQSPAHNWRNCPFLQPRGKKGKEHTTESRASSSSEMKPTSRTE